MNTRIRTRMIGMIAMVIAAVFSTVVMAEDSRPYTAGPVSQVTSVRTKPGMFDEYIRFLAGPFRMEQEELKKLGIVTSYSFYTTDPRTPHDPDLYILVTYKNMASLDALMEKSDAVDAKVFGSLKQSDKAQMDREAIREIIGTETIREIKVK